MAIKAVIELKIRTTQHKWEPLLFQFDSGTNVTALSVSAAKALSFPVPARVVAFDIRTPFGTSRQPVHPGHLTVRIAGFEGREFRWPCHFVDHPGLPPLSLLGLTGVVEDLRIILEGSYALEAPYGWFILEELSR